MPFFDRETETINLHWVYLGLLAFNCLFIITVVANIIAHYGYDSFYKAKANSTSKFFQSNRIRKLQNSF